MITTNYYYIEPADFDETKVDLKAYKSSDNKTYINIYYKYPDKQSRKLYFKTDHIAYKISNKKCLFLKKDMSFAIINIFNKLDELVKEYILTNHIVKDGYHDRQLNIINNKYDKLYIEYETNKNSIIIGHIIKYNKHNSMSYDIYTNLSMHSLSNMIKFKNMLSRFVLNPRMILVSNTIYYNLRTNLVELHDKNLKLCNSYSLLDKSEIIYEKEQDKFITI
jgi:hypothetical protein